MNLELGVYLRKSRMEENMDTKEVLARHRATIKELAQNRGDHIVETYEEVESGESIFARPEMVRMLESISDGHLDGILCMDIDRLSRGDMRDQGIILEAFKWSETLIITPEKTYDLNMEIDEQAAEFKTFISRQEYKQIKKRLHRGVLRAVGEGCYVANAPYGYRKIKVGKKPTLEIVEEEAVFVRSMYEMYLEGFGCHTIARHISALGAAPRRAAEFGRSTVAGILKNPTYMGVVPWNRVACGHKGAHGHEKSLRKIQPKENWMMAQGLHQPIISKEQFERVQEMMGAKDTGRYMNNDGTVKSPLAGIVFCASCGRHMQRMYMKKIPYLLCNTPGCCASAKFCYVEESVLEHLQRKLDELSVERTESAGKETERIRKTEKTLEAEANKAETAKKKLYELLEQGVYSVDTFRERMTIANEKIAGIERKREELRSEIRLAEGTNRKALARKIKNALDAYDATDAAGRNALLRGVVEKIVYTKKKKTKQRDFSLDVELKTV